MSESESESRGRFRSAGGRIGEGERESSGAEKLLAFVLAVFISIGAIWAYFKLDDVGSEPASSYVPVQRLLDADEFAAIQDHRQALRSARIARGQLRAATRNLELRREAYRTALDADEPAGGLRREYEAVQANRASASQALTAASAEAAQTRPAAVRAEERVTEQRQAADQQAEDERVEHDRIVFLLRLALLLLMLGGAYRLLIRLRSRNSRYLLAALAWTGATAVLAIVMAADYTDGYIEFSEVGPLAISIAGVVLTLGAFAALQRFLAKRVPLRRVRRGECSFCGFPLRGTPHCEGCGRTAVASCSSCQHDRRVGTPRCGFCGNA